MQKTITILPDHWMTTAEVASALGKSERTVQEMAKDGRLKTKSANRPSQPLARLYDPEEVRKYLPDGPRREPTAAAVARREARKRTPRPTQEERALDTVSMAGQFLAYLKSEHDAKQEREKADREDNRERFEAEQKRIAEDRERAEREKRHIEALARPWLTIKAAVDLSGYTRAQIMELCQAGIIIAIDHGGWRINRASLAATFDGAPATRALATARRTFSGSYSPNV